jgi:hypothetical protein
MDSPTALAMPSRKDYVTEANRLAKAIDIAIESFRQYPLEGWSSASVEHVVNVYSEWKYSALNPAPEYRKVASLNLRIQGALTIFQEGTGQAVDYFWKRIAAEELSYERVDRLRKVLDRGKIKGHLEYEQVTDSFIAAQQEGRITAEEASGLAEMIGDFEKRNRY